MTRIGLKFMPRTTGYDSITTDCGTLMFDSILARDIYLPAWSATENESLQTGAHRPWRISV